jgi:hypothetical protein
MGEVLCERDISIYLYKHIQSRRYINLDQHGQAYQFRVSEQDLFYAPVDISDAICRASCSSIAENIQAG